MKTQSIKKIIWVADFFGGKENLIESPTVQTLRTFVSATKAIVKPFFILNENTPKMSVQNFLVHAEYENADLIVLNTHARTGVPRLIRGSFAEGLVQHSKIPVLAFNPTTHSSEKISKVLFPTNFAQPSRRGFEGIVRLCKQLGSKLWLYYKEPLPHAQPFPELPNLFENAEQEILSQKKAAKAWSAWAKHHDVSTETIFDDCPGDVGKSILDFAKNQKMELIAMVSQSNALTTAVLGSVTRHTLRHAECPVWIQHSSFY